MTFYGEQFDEFVPLLQEGKEFFIVGFRNDFNNDDRMIRLKPKKIWDVTFLEKYLKGDLFIHIDEKSLNEEFFEKISTLFNNEKGRFNVHFRVSTILFKTLNLHSRVFKVNLTESLLKTLHQIDEIKITIELDLE